VTSGNGPRLRDYIAHMWDAIRRIDRYVADIDEATFLADEKTQDAVIRNLEIIGEAASNIRARYPEFVANHPDLPFGAAYGMRNALAHGYFKVDLGIVWRTIRRELPPLKAQLEQLIEQGPR
jgi:uncharacterized protein with HEPN domain